MTYFLSFQTSRTLGKKQCINHQRPNKSIHLTSSLLPYFACWPHNILTFLLLAFNVLKFAHFNRSTVSSSSSASPQYRQPFFHLSCKLISCSSPVYSPVPFMPPSSFLPWNPCFPRSAMTSCHLLRPRHQFLYYKTFQHPWVAPPFTEVSPPQDFYSVLSGFLSAIRAFPPFPACPFLLTSKLHAEVKSDFPFTALFALSELLEV